MDAPTQIRAVPVSPEGAAGSRAARCKWKIYFPAGTIRPIVSEVLANETLHLLLEKLESEETTRERNECLVRIYEDASDYTNDTFAYPIWPRLLRLVDLGTFSTTVLTRRSHATFTCSRGTYSLGFPLDCGDNASGTAGRRADGTSTPSGRGNHGEGGSRC